MPSECTRYFMRAFAPHFTITVVALRSENRLAHLHDIVLVDKSEVIGRPSEGVLFIVCSAHAASNHDVKP